MFSALPKNIAVPFNLLGDEAKLGFRSQPGGIAKLASTRNITETDSYWDQYVTLFDSASDVFSLISHNDVRRALHDAPENVATLIRVITTRLFNLVSDHTFPTPANVNMTSLATSFIRASTGTQARNTTKEVLNCLRVLERVLPVVFESESETSSFETEVLWKREEVTDESSIPQREEPQFVIDDEEDGEDEESAAESGPKGPSRANSRSTLTLPSLAEKLFSCLVDLLFCCGFTLSSKLQQDHHKINYVIWEKGIGSTADHGPNQSYESNRTEVLRLLLVLLSKQIYAPPSSLFTIPSAYSLHFVQHTQKRHVLTVLCSLLNTAMNSSRSEHNLMGAVAATLPYNHLMFKGEDPHANVAAISFQTLCVLLDFQSGSARDATTASGDSAPTAKTNAFRYFVAKLHRSSDFDYILNGTIGIFQQENASFNNMLPGSRKPVPYMLEAVVFFWKMIELNKKFRAYLLDSDKAMDMLAYLYCYGIEIKDKPQQHGLCRALSYIVQSLSAEAAFGVKLSTPIKAQVPQKWSSLGTAADFMIHATYAMVATTSGALTSLYPAFVIALANSAPYFKNLSVTSSTRLIQLFQAFSNPSFLLNDEGHPRLLFFMLETFNAVLLHNLSENPNLVYGILHAHKAFEDLGTFTLARGLREIRRIQQAKEERARAAEGALNKGKRRATDIEAEPHLEKARLLQSENESSTELEQVHGSSDNFLGRLERSVSVSEEDPATTKPLMSPTLSEAPPFRPPSVGPSEKARGKMKAQRSVSMSLEMTGSLERLAATGVGRNGFVPRQEWVTSWQQGLPLDPILLMISELLPKVEAIQATLNPTNVNAAVIDLIRNTNLQDALPKPPPLAPRRFMWSDASLIWLSSLIWGEIYIKGMTPLGIWSSTNVRLFYVKHAQAQQRPITEAVTNVVGGLLGRSDSSQSLRQRT